MLEEEEEQRTIPVCIRRGQGLAVEVRQGLEGERARAMRT